MADLAVLPRGRVRWAPNCSPWVATGSRDAEPTLPGSNTNSELLQSQGREKLGIFSLAAASFQDRDRAHGTIALWWKQCLRSSPTPKSPSHLSMTKAPGPFCSEDAQPPHTASKHNLLAAARARSRTPFPPGAGKRALRQVKGREIAPGAERQGKGPAGCGQPGNPEPLLRGFI